MYQALTTHRFPRLPLAPRLWALFTIFLVGLAACSSLNPLTLARMARMDPLTVPPGEVAARLTLPEGLVVRPGDAALAMTLTRKSSGEALSERFALVPSGPVWALSTQDAARLSQMQAVARNWGAADREGSLSIFITGCKTGDGPAPDALIAVDLSFDGGRSFAPLLRNLKARDVLAVAEEPGALRICQGA